MIVFPNCKINLGLQVRRRRADGYHDLETIFYPVPVYDMLEGIQVAGKGHITFTASGRAVTATPQQNLCFKAYGLLQGRFPDLPSVALHLHKVLPSGAGLGGGSADAAFTLMLLNEKLGLGLSTDELAALALQLGSDCPFFLYNRPGFASGRGERIEALALDLSGYWLQLVHTGLHIPTSAAFSRVRPDDDRPSLRTLATLPVAQWRDTLHNDFEDSVFPQYPELAELKQDLYDRGACYAAMTGSGSAVFGIFPKEHTEIASSYPPDYFVRSIRL
ncbi:4-(cytidine 5'-diphospho)-2-C-methyl-D-erythritol kinase [Flaviaesturariibacter flavus]|uniref:4-diphosphocytidyl-2-C-methyl-D-erythritol kinase n=1 Tax=Flaviaesturariibacter flavus TaxID=2502780 RepID=A0A4R1BH51_9BACT|nr:4-(cytidine 5'-diphospho)-2-C-methyl-D-erythritol kinase [Flaviaesturariibacter flavus]TCJ16549.1 4-(cytidine 5'-diphospho)-2-C-methyl-D-erythritol kinase [Flaviaesturariibacter flavus]